MRFRFTEEQEESTKERVRMVDEDVPDDLAGNRGC